VEEKREALEAEGQLLICLSQARSSVFKNIGENSLRKSCLSEANAVCPLTRMLAWGARVLSETELLLVELEVLIETQAAYFQVR
jgi:hypothetical protein